MSYVPVVVPVTTPQPPSPRTRELASLLIKVVDEYRSAHPSATEAEIREALRLAQATTGGRRASLALAVGLALALVFGVLLLGLVFAGDGAGSSGSMRMVVFGIMVFLGILMVAIKVANR